MTICTVREIQQLDMLRERLELESDCIDPGSEGEIHYLIGYCQGLFNQEGTTPSEHTRRMISFLQDLNAPSPNSHELFMGLKPRNISIDQYLQDAIPPLGTEGRVPIIITTYDPATDSEAIDKILSTQPPVADHHTILVRVQLNSQYSLDAAANMVHGLYKTAVEQRKMPTYWPLIQADSFNPNDWERFESAVGEKVIHYVTLAVTPFTPREVLDRMAENIAVYQFFVGKPNGVHEDGGIELSSKACVENISQQGEYNVFKYALNLKSTGLKAQVGIICGQSHGWDQSENLERVGLYVQHVRIAAKMLWNRAI